MDLNYMETQRRFRKQETNSTPSYLQLWSRAESISGSPSQLKHYEKHLSLLACALDYNLSASYSNPSRQSHPPHESSQVVWSYKETGEQQTWHSDSFVMLLYSFIVADKQQHPQQFMFETLFFHIYL